MHAPPDQPYDFGVWTFTTMDEAARVAQQHIGLAQDGRSVCGYVAPADVLKIVEHLGIGIRPGALNP